jgi:hypothetical protein
VSDLSEQLHMMRAQREMPMGYPGNQMPEGGRDRQSFASPLPAGLGEQPGSRLEIVPDELQLRALSTRREIATIQHLRQQIQLPAAVMADPGFAALEKKETSPGWSPHSGGAI